MRACWRLSLGGLSFRCSDRISSYEKIQTHHIVHEGWVTVFPCFFLCFLQDYNLTDEIEQAGEFTVFAPTDAAVNDYLKKMAVTALVCEEV